jgi:hypothetical protein
MAFAGLRRARVCACVGRRLKSDGVENSNSRDSGTICRGPSRACCARSRSLSPLDPFQMIYILPIQSDTFQIFLNFISYSIFSILNVFWFHNRFSPFGFFSKRLRPFSGARSICEPQNEVRRISSLFAWKNLMNH